MTLDAQGGFAWSHFGRRRNARRWKALHRPAPSPSCRANRPASSARWQRSSRRGFRLSTTASRARFYHRSHRRHADVPPQPQADADPLVDVGRGNLTAHVDFTAVALAERDAGLEVLGYTSQALLSLQLRPARRPGGRRPARARDGAKARHRGTRWASCSGGRLRDAGRVFDDRLRRGRPTTRSERTGPTCAG